MRRSHNPLEISGRPGKERSDSFRKKIKFVFKLAALAGLSVGAVYGGRTALERYVWQNPAYALSDLRVTTDGLLTRAQIVEITGLQDGENIFRVDLKKARLALDQLPQVERVEVRRVLPDRVDIKISERQPVAWVAASASARLGTDGEAFLVDVRGFVMRSRKILPEHMALPVITGIVMEDVAPGQKLPSAEALCAVELIRLAADDLKWQPRVVDISKGYCLTVTDNRRARVTFGFDSLEEQLSKLRQLIELVEPTQKEFVSVNLMLERSIPVVFAQPSNNSGLPEAKGGKQKSSSGKGGTPPSSSKLGEDAPRNEPLSQDSLKTASVSIGSKGVPLGVSGGIVESSKEPPIEVAVGAVTKPNSAASAASSRVAAGFSKQPVEPTSDRSGAIAGRETEASIRSRSKAASVVSTPATQVSSRQAQSLEKEPIQRTGARKVSKAKSNRTGGSNRAVLAERAASPSERTGSSPASGARSSRGVGPSLKGPSAGGDRPSLSPSEALRKLFSPHG